MDAAQESQAQKAPVEPQPEVVEQKQQTGGVRGQFRGVGYGDGATMVRPGAAAGDPPPDASALVARFGALLGADLSGVRIHLGSPRPGGHGAAGTTDGSDIHLGVTAAQLMTRAGQRLLAHELVHVVQQKRATATPSPVGDAESEADRVAERVASGSPAPVRASASAGRTLHKKGNGGLLTGIQEQAAIAYNKKQGYGHATIVHFQSVVGTTPDGFIGPLTCEAIARYQQSHGLTPDGRIGPLTRAAIEGAGGGTTGAAPPKQQGPLLTRKAIQNAVEWYDTRAPIYPPSVAKQIQAKVGAEADGAIGPKTVAAIAAWQKAHGLDADGYAGHDTLTAMFGQDIRASMPEHQGGKEANTGAGEAEMPFQRPSGLTELQKVFGKPGTSIGTFAMRAGAGGKLINVPCHKKVGPVLQKVFDDIFAAGLSSHIHSYDGCYVYRTKRKSSKAWSTHAWGIAIDINASTNAMTSKANMKVSDSQKKIAPYFEKHGFYWGAAFGDPMHFQYCTGY